MLRNVLNMKSGTLTLAAMALTVLLTGCGVGPINTSSAGPDTVAVQISGTVHGGQSPISHSLVQLWETSTSTYGGTTTQLVASTYSMSRPAHLPSARRTYRAIAPQGPSPTSQPPAVTPQARRPPAPTPES